MNRYKEAISQGVLVGFAYIGLNRLAGSPIPLFAEIASAIGAALALTIYKLVRTRKGKQA